MLVELPNNQSAVLRNYDELTERQARRIRSSLRSALELAGVIATSGYDDNDPSTYKILKDMDEGEGTAIDDYTDRCIVEMVKSWTLGDLPTMETVGDLPTATYAVLGEAAVLQTRDNEQFTADGAADPKVLTENSNVSAPISSDVASNQLTPSSPINGESTVTAL